MNWANAINQGVAGFQSGYQQSEDRQNKQVALADAKRRQGIADTQKADKHNLEMEELRQSVAKGQTEAKQVARTDTKRVLFEAFGSNSLININEMIKNNPAMKTLLPGVQSIKKVPPGSEAMESYKASGQQFTEPVLLTLIQPGPDGEPTVVEKVADLAILKASSGYSSYKAARDAERTKNENTSVSQDIMTAAMRLGPKETMEALKITRPELFIEKSGKGSSRRDALEQYTIAFQRAYPDATPEQYEKAMQDYVLKISSGSKAVKEEKDISTVVETVTETPTADVNLDGVEQKAMAALSSSNKKEYDRVQKDITQLKDNSNLATNIERVLKGSGKKVDTDMIEKVKDSMYKLTGIEDKQALANVDFNTESGMLLADYILSRSGTAASDTERDFLTSLMKSGNLSDETYVRQALKAFAGQLRGNNATLAKDIEKLAPASAKKYGPVRMSQEERQKKIDFLKANK